MDANEIFGSVRTNDVRCASPPTVVHAPPPRPCAETATTAPISTAPVQPRRELIIRIPASSIEYVRGASPLNSPTRSLAGPRSARRGSLAALVRASPQPRRRTFYYF